MLAELTAGVALAATFLSPAPEASMSAATSTSDAATAGSVITVPLVRESLGVWYTLPVDQTCPDTHPYVHRDKWTGTLPEHVTFLAAIGGVPGSPATRLSGPMTNWNFSVKDVSIDLICTSDPDQAVAVESRGL